MVRETGNAFIAHFVFASIDKPPSGAQKCGKFQNYIYQVNLVDRLSCHVSVVGNSPKVHQSNKGSKE